MPTLCPQCHFELAGAAVPVCPHCRHQLSSQPPLPATPRAPTASLSVRTSAGAFWEVVLDAAIRIGRHPESQLRLTAREVSKEHAAIELAGPDWCLEDLRSSNGTFVNGRRITRLKLKDGDAISIGSTLLTFHSPASPVAPRGPRVTIVQSFSPHVLASVHAQEPGQRDFRPEREITDLEQLRRDYEKLRIAMEFHRQVGLERDLGALYDKILQVAFELLKADNGVILLCDAESGALKPGAVRRSKGDEVVVSQTLIDQAVKKREGVLTRDAIVDERFSAAASIVAQGIRSAMAVPLLAHGELRGALYLDTREIAGAFTEKDLLLLTGIAAQAGVAIEGSELARRIEQEAETRAQLSRFLSPALVEQAQKGQLELKKGGELCEVTVLFADIRGFTAMTERAQPQEIVTLLNELFELMADEVFENGGVLDKFIGDCIMALWGAPVRRSDDATRALRAAIGMQQRLVGYNRERQAAGKAPVAMGIGVNTGQAVVGNMGSSKRLDYTAIGDAVNLAARLCDLARGCQVVASAATLEKADQSFEAVEMPAAKVKGKRNVVEVFEVLGLSETTSGGDVS
jgi:adenylate cyclase